MRRPAPGWQRAYQRALVLNDFTMGLLGSVVAGLLRWRLDPPSVQLPLAVLALLVPVAWVVTLYVGDGYERSALGFGIDEFRRVLSSGVNLLAVMLIALAALDSHLSRAVAFGSIAFVVLFTIGGRYGLRRVVRAQRRAGRATHEVLVVGMRESVRNLTVHFDRVPDAGYAVAGACVPASGETELAVGDRSVPVLGGPDDIEAVLAEFAQIDVLAVADTNVLSDGDLRRLAWLLGDAGVDLIVAPAISDLAGPRISVNPVAGLPLLHVEEPRFNGAPRLLKRVAECLAATLALLLLAPLLAMIAVLVKVTSKGPVLFRQERVGLDGRPFRMWKFRSMKVGAEHELVLLLDRNEQDGLLFKMRDDPRVTRVGRWLRRYSLDELPQLLHVLTGSMALVGPRPPLPTEVEHYDDIVRRRLLVRPGITGLWQVSGRADLSWQESVRLDVYYVDNWSIALDAAIVLKTVAAMVRAKGAY
jgi:exopolysaccharide biosynthesis polyprenyl glycosylphosphotransferase